MYAGAFRKLIHFGDLGAWSTVDDMPTPGASAVTTVWGSGPNDLYVGSYFRTLHRGIDGRWSAIDHAGEITDGMALSADDVYAILGYGAIRHSAGDDHRTAHEVVGGYAYCLGDLWVTGTGVVYLLAWNQFSLHFPNFVLRIDTHTGRRVEPPALESRRGPRTS